MKDFLKAIWFWIVNPLGATIDYTQYDDSEESTKER